jgi:hypothetical protein
MTKENTPSDKEYQLPNNQRFIASQQENYDYSVTENNV